MTGRVVSNNSYGACPFLAVLASLTVPDIAAELCGHPYATDASLAKGAVVVALSNLTISKCAWKAFSSKVNTPSFFHQIIKSRSLCCF